MEKIQNYFKVFIPISIAASICYEIAFFMGFGVGIKDAPIGTADFLRGWLQWSAYGWGLFAGYFISNILIRRIEGWKTEEQIIASAKDPEKLRRFRNSPYKFIRLGAIFLGMQFLFVGEVSFLPLYLLSIWLAIDLVKWLFIGSPYENYLINQRSMFLIVCLVGFLVLGFERGSITMRMKYSDIEPSLELQAGENVKVIRILDQWSLVKTKDEEFGWVNHQSGKLIKFKANRYQFVGLLCYAKKNFEFASKWNIYTCKNFYSYTNN